MTQSNKNSLHRQTETRQFKNFQSEYQKKYNKKKTEMKNKFLGCF